LSACETRERRCRIDKAIPDFASAQSGLHLCTNRTIVDD
jgi:hypothetical protein